MPPKPPRRTRERILETALAMFNQFGEPTVATPSIAFKMGISPGNLHCHYHSKKAIVADLFAEFQREIETTLPAPEAPLPNAEDCYGDAVSIAFGKEPRVNLTLASCRSGMTAICAHRTAGVDVKLPFAMTGTKTTAATFQLANHGCSGCFRLERL